MCPLRGPRLARHPRGGSAHQLAGLPSPLQVTLSLPCCRPPPSLAHVPWPIPTSPRAGLQPGSSECLGKGLEQKVWPAARPCWGLGGVGLRPSSPGTRQVWSRVLTGLSPPDLENHQHACVLAQGGAGLLCLPGALVQDSRLPLVSVAARAWPSGRAWLRA